MICQLKDDKFHIGHKFIDSMKLLTFEITTIPKRKTLDLGFICWIRFWSCRLMYLCLHNLEGPNNWYFCIQRGIECIAYTPDVRVRLMTLCYVIIYTPIAELQCTFSQIYIGLNGYQIQNKFFFKSNEFLTEISLLDEDVQFQTHCESSMVRS